MGGVDAVNQGDEVAEGVGEVLDEEEARIPPMGLWAAQRETKRSSSKLIRAKRNKKGDRLE